MEWQNIKFYAETMSWKLFPCSAKSKQPLTHHGFKDATTDLTQLAAWHQQHTDCAWGLATSAALGVIDVDARSDGAMTLASLEATHGTLPLTPRCRTGGGGHHYYFSLNAGTGCSQGRIGKGIDVRADGGYVILPPSKIDCPGHEGRSYAWEVKPWETPAAEAPPWLSALALAKVKAMPASQIGTVDPWVVGEPMLDLFSHPGVASGRTPMLCKLVGVHLARGDSKASIAAMAEAWSAKCVPPLTEWRKHVDGLVAKESGKALEMTPPKTSQPFDAHVCSLPPGTDNYLTNSASASAIAPSLLVSFQSPAAAEHESFDPELVSLLSVPAAAEHESFDPELVSLLSVPAENTSLDAEGLGSLVVSTDWPILKASARHGLLGKMLHAVEPETEADPAGVLLGWLCCFGSVVGRGAYVKVGADLHYPSIFLGIVGRTSDAKGVSWGVAKYPFAQVDPTWAKLCICPGVGSGQGLIERVRDERRSLKIGRDGEIKETIVPAAMDKRCLLRLDELAICFKLQRTESSTLGETLLTAWGGEPLEVPNRTDNSLIATGYTIGVMGDTQPGTVRKLLESGKGFEGHNGWLNRFLWAAVRSDKDLPSGGNLEVLEPYLKPLAEALDYAKTAGEVKRDASAEGLWNSVYGDLKRSGDSVTYTDRARPYVVRLSLLFALIDKSNIIKLEHLQAAIAMWDYCKSSAKIVFAGANSKALPDPLWLKVLNVITLSPGITRKGMYEDFHGRLKADELAEALTYLQTGGLAHAVGFKPKGGGRPGECWFPGVSPEPEPEGGEDMDYTPKTKQAMPECVPLPGGENYLTNSACDFGGVAVGGDNYLTNSRPKGQPECVPLPGGKNYLTNSALTPVLNELISSQLESKLTDSALGTAPSLLVSYQAVACATSHEGQVDGGIGLGGVNHQGDDYEAFLAMLDAAKDY